MGVPRLFRFCLFRFCVYSDPSRADLAGPVRRFAIAAGPGSVTVSYRITVRVRVRVTVSSGYPVFAIAYFDRAERPDRHRGIKSCVPRVRLWCGGETVGIPSAVPVDVTVTDVSRPRADLSLRCGKSCGVCGISIWSAPTHTIRGIAATEHRQSYGFQEARPVSATSSRHCLPPGKKAGQILKPQVARARFNPMQVSCLLPSVATSRSSVFGRTHGHARTAKVKEGCLP